MTVNYRITFIIIEFNTCNIWVIVRRSHVMHILVKTSHWTTFSPYRSFHGYYVRRIATYRLHSHYTPGRFENSAKKSQLAFTFILQYAGAKLFENVTFAVTERDAWKRSASRLSVNRNAATFFEPLSKQ